VGEGETEADRVSTAVLACPDVIDVSAGAFGEIRSYLPGRSVPGVQVDEDRVEVHVVARYGPPLRNVADQIRRAVAPLLAGRTLQISVDDIALPERESDTETAGAQQPPTRQADGQ